MILMAAGWVFAAFLLAWVLYKLFMDPRNYRMSELTVEGDPPWERLFVQPPRPDLVDLGGETFVLDPPLTAEDGDILHQEPGGQLHLDPQGVCPEPA